MRLTSWLSLISNTGAARRGSSRLSRRPQRVSLDRLETLEDRLLLTVFTVDDDAPADFTTIQAAIAAATANGTGSLDEIRVAPGTYTGNIVINTSNLKLISTGGRGSTTIQGNQAGGELGTIQIVGTASDVQIGQVGGGFTIIGIDGTPGLEKAAVYVSGGPHSNLSFYDNEIRANGDSAFTSEFGTGINGLVITGNEFSGQTFTGAPAGIGSAAQFSLANVPRQLIVMGNGGGAGASNVTNVTFTNNVISGVAGGISTTDNSGNPVAPHEQGNILATLDVSNATITGNTFEGTTNATATALRVRRPNAPDAISGNTFDNTNMGASTTPLTLANNATPTSTVLAANNIVSTNPVTNTLTIDGSTGGDEVILRVVGGVTQVSTNGGATFVDVDSAITSIVINGGTGDDTFTIDYSTGAFALPITFNGGAGGNDKLAVRGNNTQSVVYTPSATTFGSGVVTSGASTIIFTGLEPVDFDNVGTFTLNLPGAADVVTVTAGFNSAVTVGAEPAGTVPALVFTGTTGGVGFEAAHVFRTTNVIVNTTTIDGADTITIASAANAHANTNLTFTTGAGADVLSVAGATTIAGAFTSSTPTVNLSNNITAATISGTATTVNVLANTAQFQDAIAISGASSTVNIAAATYTENVNATGGGKSVTLAPIGTGTVTLNGNLDLNAGDALQIQIAALGTLDNFIVNGTVTLGGATLATSLLGGFVPTVGDVFQIVTNDAADAVSGTFAGLAEGSVIILGSTRLKVSYIGGSGNDITLTALPPAVAVSFSNGNLVVTGTGNVDDFTIQVSGTNQVTLIGNNGTNFTGAGGDATTVGPFLVTGQLTVSTGNGNDIVHLSGNGPNARLDSGNVSIDLGAGNDTLTQIGPSPLRLTGNLSVVGGTGSDTVALGLTAGATDFIVANLTIDNGTDDNAATQSVTLNGLTANGNVTVTNSGNALQSVVLGAAATVISGNLKITQSGSANTLGYSVVADNAPVGGSVTITNGNTTGSTLVDWATSNVGGSTVVTNGNATGNNTVLFTSNVLTGSATVKNGNAAVNSITVDGSTLNGNSSSFTNGSATTSNTINLGLNAASTFAGVVLATNSSATGANSIIVQRGSLNGGATLSNNVAGAASNTVTLGNIDTVSVVGNLSINNANSTTSNNVNVDQLLTSGNKSGDVSINNGTSNTTNVNLGATISNTIAGNLTVRNQATVGTRTTNVSRTTVNGGSGFYLFNVGAGNSSTGIGLASPTVVLNKLKIEDGSGTAALNIRAATLGSLNFLDVGGGADTVDIAGNGGVGVVTINGVTRIDTGAASDLVRIGTTGTAVFNDSVFISLGAGDDTLTIGDNASSPAFSTASKLSFDGGAGVDSASISTLSVADYELVAPNKLSKKLKQKIKGFETLT